MESVTLGSETLLTFGCWLVAASIVTACIFLAMGDSFLHSSSSSEEKEQSESSSEISERSESSSSGGQPLSQEETTNQLERLRRSFELLVNVLPVEREGIEAIKSLMGDLISDDKACQDLIDKTAQTGDPFAVLLDKTKGSLTPDEYRNAKEKLAAFDFRMLSSLLPQGM